MHVFRWKHLLARFNKRTEALSQLRDKAKSIDDGCEFVEALLSQVDSDLSRLENQSQSLSTTSALSVDTIMAIQSDAQGLLESLKELSPKVEDIGNEYCFIAKQVSTRNPSGRMSQRVKKVIQDWRQYLERGSTLVDLCQKRLSLCEFNRQCEETEHFIKGLTDNASAVIKQVSGEDYETGSKKLERLNNELQKLEGIQTGLEEAGNALMTKDRSSENHIDSRMVAIHKLKRSLEEKLIFLENTLKKMKAAEDEEKAMEKEQEKAIQVETLTKATIDTLSAAAAAPSEVCKAVQVETLFQKRADVDSEDASSSTSDVLSTSTTQSVEPAVTLTRVDIYLQELLKALNDSDESMKLVEALVGDEDRPSEIVETQDSYESLVRAMANTQSMVDHVRHLYQLLVEEHKLSSEAAKGPEVEKLQARLRSVEERGRAYSQKLRESTPVASQVTCPVCTPSQRGAWDSTLWRLEQWLNHADAKLKQTMKKRPPTSLEQLEGAILTHRELVLDLDSHRSLVSALTGVLTHLGKHEETRTMGQVELDKLRDRLKKALEQWRKVCHRAAAWQARLQIALIENPDFHVTINQYEKALSQIQDTIHGLEPVDLGRKRKIIAKKLRKFTVSLVGLNKKQLKSYIVLITTTFNYFKNRN